MNFLGRSYFKDMPVKILWSVFFLSSMGLIILKSISNHHPSGLVYTPFFKQFLILIPAMALFLCVTILPRYSIHKYCWSETEL